MGGVLYFTFRRRRHQCAIKFTEVAYENRASGGRRRIRSAPLGGSSPVYTYLSSRTQALCLHPSRSIRKAISAQRQEKKPESRLSEAEQGGAARPPLEPSARSSIRRLQLDGAGGRRWWFFVIAERLLRFPRCLRFLPAAC